MFKDLEALQLFTQRASLFILSHYITSSTHFIRLGSEQHSYMDNMDTTQVLGQKEMEGACTSINISLALSYEEEIEKADTCDKEQGSLKNNEILMKTAEVFLSSVQTEAETEPSKDDLFSDVDRDIENGDERFLTKGLHQLMFEKVHKMKNKPSFERNDLVENIKKDCVSLGARDEHTGRTLLFHLLR